MRERIAVIAGAVGAALAWPAQGIAQEGEQVGENIGELLAGWGQALFVGIVAVISLVLLVKRQMSELAIFVVAAIVVGGFVFAPDAIATTVEDIWTTVTGG